MAGPVAAVNFRPVDQLVADADQRLRDVEGRAFEKLVGVLYEERSRKGIGGFPLSERINGYWDRSDTEIDLVALNATDRVIRLGSCKRSAAELVRDLPVFCGHIERFLRQFPEYAAWRVERVSLAPHVHQDVRQEIERHGSLVQDLNDLRGGL